MGRQAKPCGTEAAYYRHKYRGEEPCDIDRRAAAEASRRRNRARGMRPFKPAKHGTTSKYVGGCRCRFCKDAQAAYLRAWRAGKPYKGRREAKAWKTRDDILDRLELDGWMTAEMLAMESGRNPEAVTRVLRQLRDEGLVVSRQVELALASNRTAFESRTEWRVA